MRRSVKVVLDLTIDPDVEGCPGSSDLVADEFFEALHLLASLDEPPAGPGALPGWLSSFDSCDPSSLELWSVPS